MIQFFLALVPAGEELFFHSFQDFYLFLFFFVRAVVVPVVVVVHTAAVIVVAVVAIAVHVTAVVVVCWFLELQFLGQFSLYFVSGGAVKTTFLWCLQLVKNKSNCDLLFIPKLLVLL